MASHSTPLCLLGSMFGPSGNPARSVLRVDPESYHFPPCVRGPPWAESLMFATGPWWRPPVLFSCTCLCPVQSVLDTAARGFMLPQQVPPCYSLALLLLYHPDKGQTLSSGFMAWPTASSLKGPPPLTPTLTPHPPLSPAIPLIHPYKLLFMAFAPALSSFWKVLHSNTYLTDLFIFFKVLGKIYLLNSACPDPPINEAHRASACPDPPCSVALSTMILITWILFSNRLTSCAYFYCLCLSFPPTPQSDSALPVPGMEEAFSQSWLKAWILGAYQVHPSSHDPSKGSASSQIPQLLWNPSWPTIYAPTLKGLLEHADYFLREKSVGEILHFHTKYLSVTKWVPSLGWNTLEDKEDFPNRCIQGCDELFGCEIKCAVRLESGLAVRQMKL